MLRSATEFKTKWLAFCASYLSAYELADSLGKHAVRELNERLAIQDKSFANKARDVGRQAALLREHIEVLPPSQEAIVELARAANKNKNVANWFRSGKVTTHTTVKELRQLTSGRPAAGGADASETVLLISDDTQLLAQEVAKLLETRAAFRAQVRNNTLRDDIAAHFKNKDRDNVQIRLTK